ncbi:hypothetical protein [Streptomyces sp. NPDC059071]|uniref:hypothetical protein n=1 Tax=unclassified Streptomyces TaxID=2593676 RepID=UPI0036469129
MSKKQKAAAALAAAVVVQVLANRVAKQQAAVLGVPVFALSVVGAVVSAALL